jgi:hypothetical protein
LIFPEKKRASYLSVEKIDFRALSQQGTKYGFSVMHRHTRSQHSQPLDFECTKKHRSVGLFFIKPLDFD